MSLEVKAFTVIPEATENTKKIVLDKLEDDAFEAVNISLELGRNVSLEVSYKDFNHGRIFSTEGFTANPNYFFDPSKELPKVQAILRKRKSRKNADKSVYDVIITSGHSVLANLLMARAKVDVVITKQIDDSQESKINSYYNLAIRPYSVFLRNFRESLGAI